MYDCNTPGKKKVIPRVDTPARCGKPNLTGWLLLVELRFTFFIVRPVSLYWTQMFMLPIPYVDHAAVNYK